LLPSGHLIGFFGFSGAKLGNVMLKTILPFFLQFLGFYVVSYEVRNLVERHANREQVG
jgi:hypothetical protein